MKRFSLIVRGVFGFVIFVLVLEFCARVDDALSYGAAFWPPYNREILEMRDSIGKRGRPGARYQKWQLNSLGYRGPELRSGTTRIACFGASETFGLYEAEGQEYPRQLERQLNARFGGNMFQVVNVAYVGETVATATLRVPEIVDQIHPAYAILYPSAAAYIWLPWVREGPAPAPATSALPDTTPPPVRFEWRIRERFRNLLKQALPAIVQTKLRQREINAAVGNYSVMDSVPQENVLRFRRDMSRLVATLRAAGVEPVLVTHATAFGKALSESDRDLLVAWRKFYPMLKEGGFLDMEKRMNDAIRDLARQEHVVLVDAASEIPPGRENFADFSHFTTPGAAIMASRLADGLQPMIDAQLRQDSSNLPQRPAAPSARN
jgi:lysophospholipase L1-like esterase